uniref:Uncharacterized protein n=1 Tax=Zea mays TaxID=4577 RepID=A0A804UDD4_MAIZE
MAATAHPRPLLPLPAAVRARRPRPSCAPPPLRAAPASPLPPAAPLPQAAFGAPMAPSFLRLCSATLGPKSSSCSPSMVSPLRAPPSTSTFPLLFPALGQGAPRSGDLPTPWTQGPPSTGRVCHRRARPSPPRWRTAARPPSLRRRCRHGRSRGIRRLSPTGSASSDAADEPGAAGGVRGAPASAAVAGSPRLLAAVDLRISTAGPPSELPNRRDSPAPRDEDGEEAVTRPSIAATRRRWDVHRGAAAGVVHAPPSPGGHSSPLPAMPGDPSSTFAPPVQRPSSASTLFPASAPLLCVLRPHAAPRGLPARATILTSVGHLFPGMDTLRSSPLCRHLCPCSPLSSR